MTPPATCATLGCDARLGKANKTGFCRRHHMEHASARVSAWWADSANNPLAALSTAERRDYDTLKRHSCYTRAEVLTAIGRSDLICRVTV